MEKMNILNFRQMINRRFGKKMVNRLLDREQLIQTVREHNGLRGGLIGDLVFNDTDKSIYYIHCVDGINMPIYTCESPEEFLFDTNHFTKLRARQLSGQQQIDRERSLAYLEKYGSEGVAIKYQEFLDSLESTPKLSDFYEIKGTTALNIAYQETINGGDNKCH
jgi:hypothetical protein